MKLQKAVLVLMGMMLLFAGKLSAQQVKTDYDRGANFGQYKTYSWAQVKTKEALDVDRIKTAVNAALAAKGWTQVDSGGDVSIVAMEITRNQQTLNTFYEGVGGCWRWVRPIGRTRSYARGSSCWLGTEFRITTAINHRVSSFGRSDEGVRWQNGTQGSHGANDEFGAQQRLHLGFACVMASTIATFTR